MAKIPFVSDRELPPDMAESFAVIAANHPTGQVPAIYRTMSYHSGFFHAIKDAAESIHFHDGALTRAQHELIASYVSALNRCRY